MNLAKNDCRQGTGVLSWSMVESHPLLNVLDTGKKITLEGQTVEVDALADRQEGIVVYTVHDLQEQGRRLLKIASPTDDPQAYEEWKKLLTIESRVLERLNTAMADSRSHVPRVRVSSEAHIEDGRLEHVYPMALLTDLPRGTLVEQLLYADTALGEHTGLQIGSQLARVVALAHQEGYLCGPLSPGRLFWEGSSQHLTVTAWYSAQDMQGEGMPLDERATQKQQDVHNLAHLIWWIVTGKEQPATRQNGLPASTGTATGTLSEPLHMLLSEAIQNPLTLGDDPAQRFSQHLSRLLKHWDAPNLYALTEEHVTAALERKSAVDMRTLRIISEQVGVGKTKEPTRAWDDLLTNIDSLLEQPLEQIRQTIIGGQFVQALWQVRSLPTPITMQRQVLWRQRLAEIGVADPRLTSDPVYARYRAQMGDALREWDRGNYVLPDWLQQMGSLFSKYVLAPAAQVPVQRLGNELTLAGLIDQFHSSPDTRKRLEASDELEKMSLPEGISGHLLEERQQVLGLRDDTMARHQNEQQQQAFQSIFPPLERRVLNDDPSLTNADFEHAIRTVLVSEYRQKIYELQSIWKSIKFIRAVPEHGEMHEAVRAFIRVRRASVEPPVLTELESILATEAQQYANLEGAATTIARVFDRIYQLPRRSFDDLVQHRRWLHMLLPAVDHNQRLLYDSLLAKETQVRKDLEMLEPTSTATPQEQLEALEDLRRKGIVSLQHLYLRVMSQLQIQQDQDNYQHDLMTTLEQTLAKLQGFHAARPQIPMSFGEDVAAIRQSILSSQGVSASLKDKHRFLWDQVCHFAPAYQDIYYQHLYFSAQQAAAELKKLWVTNNAYQGLPELQIQTGAERALAAAREVGRLRAMLAGTEYEVRVTSFVAEQRELLNTHIRNLLRFDARTTPVEEQAHMLSQARQYLAVSEAFGFDCVQPAHELATNSTVLAPLLAHQETALRRVALSALPVDTSSTQVLHLLQSQNAAAAQAESTSRSSSFWQSPYLLAIIFVALVVVVALLLLG